MATARENIMKVFRHEMPDYVPIVCSCDPYNQPSREGMPEALAQRLGTVQWHDTSCVELARWLGIESYARLAAPVRASHKSCVSHTEWEDGERHTWWETPHGELHERWRRNTPDGPMFCVEHFLKGPRDLKAMAATFEDEQVELDPDRVDAVMDRKRYVGEDGILVLAFPGTPLGMLVRVYAGVQTLAYMTVDCETELRDLLAAMADNYLRRLRLLEAVDVVAVHSVDDTSTTTMSPRMFESYAMPYIDAAAEEAQRQGKLYIHHSCGYIKDLVALYRRTKMDVVHALCIPPLGNVTIAEAKVKLGPGIAMVAPFVQMFQGRFDANVVRASVAQMFREAAPGDNFMLNLAADPNRTLDHMECILDEARKHRYLC